MKASTEAQFIKNFGKQLAMLRKEKRLSQEELASRANMHAVAITYIETGKRKPGLISLYKLAKALEINPEDLLKNL
jgi:transcriptional regulator with XRE-family HTH domain